MLRESVFQCCSWPSGWYTRHNSGWRSYRETAFGTGIQHMKQFAHNRYLPCCQCTETFRPYQHVIIIAMPYLEQFIATYTSHIYFDIYFWFNFCPLCFNCLQLKFYECPSHWCFCACRTYHLILSYSVRRMRLRSQKNINEKTMYFVGFRKYILSPPNAAYMR